MHEQLSSHSLFCLKAKFPDDQFGFLCGRSAEWQLLSVVERWHKALDKRHLVYTVFLDAAKAFDRVDHRLVLQSFYSSVGSLRHFATMAAKLPVNANRSIRVHVMDTLSTAASIRSGVPQSSVLGSLLSPFSHFRRIPESNESQSNFTVRR